MTLTRESVLQDAIVRTLGNRGGSARRGEVLAEMEADLKPVLTVEDREPVASRTFEQRWMNNASYARDHMKLSLLTPRADGVWELSADGWDRFRVLSGAAPSVGGPGVGDPLAAFKPKDSSSYVANLSGRRLVKSRSHEDLIERFGRWVVTRGFIPSTAVHPRDLVLDRTGEIWLVEAKIVYHGNVAEATRGAVAQLLEYRHFFHPGLPRPFLVGLFSESVGDAFVAYLDSLLIAAVWNDRSGGWAASARGVAAGLA